MAADKEAAGLSRRHTASRDTNSKISIFASGRVCINFNWCRLECIATKATKTDNGSLNVLTGKQAQIRISIFGEICLQ